MGAISIEQLLRHWELGNITTEQAVGQILQHMGQLKKDQQDVSEILDTIIREVRKNPTRAER